MKKILIALTAILSFAGVSFAEAQGDDPGFISGTSFESLTPGSSLDTSADDYWGGTNPEDGSFTGDDAGTISNGVVDVSSRPAAWTSIDDGETRNFLKVDTSELLLRKISNEKENNIAKSFDIGDGIYVDTVVQFTASDATTIDTDSADKLVVWLQVLDEQAEGGPATNLIVTAGCYEEGKFGPKDYIVNCNGVEPGKWYRLTIKSMKAGESAAFVVFVNSVAVTCEEAKSAFFGETLDSTAKSWLNQGALFPSLVNAGGNKQTITSLGVEGSGYIDDITFTTNAPSFAADGTLFTLNWDANAFATLAINGENLKIDDGQVILPFGKTAGDNVFTLTYTLADGFSWAAPTCDAAVTFDSGAFTAKGTAVATLNTKQAVFKVGDVNYESLADALLAAGAGDTVKLLANVKLGSGEVLDFTGYDVVFDLMGKTISDADDNMTDPTIQLDEGSLTIIDSIGGGKIIGKYEDGVIYADGNLIIGAVSGDRGVTIDGLVYAGPEFSLVGGTLTIYIGRFSDLGDDEFPYSTSLASGSSASASMDADGYWVVTRGDTPAALTITVLGEADELATYELLINEEPADTGAEIKANDEIVIIAAPITGYEYTTAPEGWSLDTGSIVYEAIVVDESIIVTIPTPTAKQATTYFVQTYTNGVEYVQVEYTAGAASIALTDPVYDSESEEWDGKWYTEAEGSTEFVFDGSVAGNTQVAYARITTKTPPPPTTYALTWNTPEKTTVVASTNEVPVESGTEFAAGTEIVFSVSPDNNYTYDGVTLGDWTLNTDDGSISYTATMPAEALEVTIPAPVPKEAPGGDWDIPGTEGGINAIVGEDDVRYVEFSSIAFTATGATVGLKAGKIDADGQTFGLVCKTDLTSKDTFVINATLTAVKDAATGTFAIEAAELTGKDQLFVIGVGPATK